MSAAAWGGIVMLAVAAGCASGRGPASSAGPIQCPTPPDSTGPNRLADVFIDGVRVASLQPARLESAEPESYSLVGPEPPALQAISPDRIDLIQFLRGPDAERDYGLCSGIVAMLITTRKR